MRALLLAAASLLLATSALAQNAPPSQGQPISSSGKDFLGFAAQVNVSEIGGGLVAEQKAQAPAVKAFGRLMTLDHSELQSQLDAIAAAANVALPDQSNADDKQMNQLKSMNGSQFDAAYMKDMVDGHQMVVSRFKSEQSSAPGIRAVVLSALPIIEQHLALAKAVQASLTSSENSASNR